VSDDRLRPGSIYRLPTCLYGYVEIGLEGLRPDEAAAQVQAMRAALVAAGLLVRADGVLPPVPAGVAAPAEVPAAAPSPASGWPSLHALQLREADAAAAARAVPPPTIPAAATAALPSTTMPIRAPRTPPQTTAFRSPSASITDAQVGAIRALARREGRTARMRAWLGAEGRPERVEMLTHVQAIELLRLLERETA